MKVLYIDNWIHPKNLNALEKYNFNMKKITINDLKNMNIENYDVVYSPSLEIDVAMYPNTKFIFGPHLSTFPNAVVNKIKGTNTIYIQPSQWAKEMWKKYEICQDLHIKELPFGVDTDRFSETKSIAERTKVMLYYKNRNIDELITIVTFLNERNINYKLFSYKNGYSEDDFLSYLHETKYAIWVGCAESQGFALEETLSCNIPILVWNVTSITQEINQNYPHHAATSIPYWSNECGEVFYDKEQFENTYNLFISKLYEYKPREYILKNLSIDKCKNRFIELLETI